MTNLDVVCIISIRPVTSHKNNSLSVFKRNHWGIGRFCLAFLASFCLIRKVFCDGWGLVQFLIGLSRSSRGSSSSRLNEDFRLMSSFLVPFFSSLSSLLMRESSSTERPYVPVPRCPDDRSPVRICPSSLLQENHPPSSIQ